MGLDELVEVLRSSELVCTELGGGQFGKTAELLIVLGVVVTMDSLWFEEAEWIEVAMGSLVVVELVVPVEVMAMVVMAVVAVAVVETLVLSLVTMRLEMMDPFEAVVLMRSPTLAVVWI